MGLTEKNQKVSFTIYCIFLTVPVFLYVFQGRSGIPGPPGPSGPTGPKVNFESFWATTDTFYMFIKSIPVGIPEYKWE